MAKLRSKLRQLDAVKKDELIKKLEAKEHECLEYRAKLEPMTSGITSLNEQPLLQVLEKEVARKMTEARSQMENSRQRIEGLI